MATSFSNCAEVAGPVCLLLAERWQAAGWRLNECERNNLEMATMVVLRWIAIGDHVCEAKLSQAATLLKAH